MSENQDYDWIKKYIDYKPVEDIPYYHPDVEDKADDIGCEVVDIVGTILFEGSPHLMRMKEGNEYISAQSLQDPWRYKCIMKELTRHFTFDELEEKFPVSKTTIKKHAKKQGVIGEKRVDWEVESSWETARKKTIERDGECVACGMSSSEHKRKYDRDLTAHHIVPRRLFDEKRNADSLDNLVALCRDCHQSHEVTPRKLFLKAVENTQEL